jgi:hypothetical protein
MVDKKVPVYVSNEYYCNLRLHHHRRSILTAETTYTLSCLALSTSTLTNPPPFATTPANVIDPGMQALAFTFG